MNTTSLDGLDVNVDRSASEGVDSTGCGVWAFTRSQRRLLQHGLNHQVQVIEAVVGSGLEGAESRATRINCCCQVVQVGASAIGRPAVQMHRCRDRLCQICSRYRSIACEEKVSAMVRSMLTPRLITLTLAEDGCSLSERLDRLVKSYRKLRQRKLWKSNVRGAAAVIEVTRGQGNRHWHVHLHVLADFEWIPQASLADSWLEITGDSRIVDVRPVRSGERAAKYVAKYAAKGVDWGSLDAHRQREFVRAMFRRRTFITSGNLHGITADNDDWESRHQAESETISVAKVRAAAKRDCLAAQRVLRLMAMAGGLPALFATDPGCPTMPLAEEEWTDRHGREFRRVLRSCRRWIENHDEYLLPPPPPYTGKQCKLDLGHLPQRTM